LAKHTELIGQLRALHFDVGMAEAWDYAAYPLLRLIGIGQTVATLNLPIPSVFYHFMDNYLEAIVAKADIPG
jgi:hypothetical protein